MRDKYLSIRDILGPDGLLALNLQGFEYRSSQIEMASLIESAINEQVPALVEAGTGTGKTFGYLVPLVLSNKKAVISTGTKNLQEQIYFKDLPLLKKVISLDIDAMLMKGRKNYLCLHRYHQYFSRSSLQKTEENKIKKKLDKWLKTTQFADRAELSWLKDSDPVWDILSSGSDQCLGTDCAFQTDCFLGKLRSKATKTKIIIVNHHLFFADMKVKKGGFGEVIPRFQVALFDEAHNIEDIATTYIGDRFSTNQILELADDLEKVANSLSRKESSQLKKYLTTLRASSEQLSKSFEGNEEKGDVGKDKLLAIEEGPVREIRLSLRGVRGLLRTDNFLLQSLVVRAEDLEMLLEQVIRKRDEGWINWYERRKKSLVLYSSPLEIAERMNEFIYKKTNTVIFASATLSTNGTFDYIRSRLGLEENVLEGIYPSHFDFESQSLLYIPRDLPSPGSPGFVPEAAERILDILKRTRGRALVLFTSHHNMNLVFRLLNGRLPYSLLRQGEAPRSSLLEEFKRDIHSVLLATGSFWQGVDVPGEALSCLIVDKLPFDSPAEPLVAARIKSIRKRGGNPFMEYQIPSAVISLKQGLGRLIRKSSDMGILSILDTRILTSHYGRFFLGSLPAIPMSNHLADITAFFKTDNATAT